VCYSKEKKIMRYSFVFPGQGSQYVGMGQILAESYEEARDVFGTVDEALSQNLFKLMTTGTADELNLTTNTQPALMAVSMATLRVLEKQGGVDLAKTCKFVVGHSLGEYAALTAAAVLNIETTAKLLRIRGEAMQNAVPVGVGAMAAILGLPYDDVRAIAEEATADGDVCEIANDNCDGQVVISGHKTAVEKAAAIAKEKGAKRAVMLPVSAPFHCSLMAPAAENMKEALAAVSFNTPSVPVVCNVSAVAEDNPDTLRDHLVKQVMGQVRWRESVIYMAENGVTHMAEIGAGKVLSGLTRRINRDIVCTAVETPTQIEAFLEGLS
jgi:[acyl-carrier-protein] S-malonyltransferase